MNENTKARLNGLLLSAAHKIGLFLAMTVICLPGLWIVTGARPSATSWLGAAIAVAGMALIFLR